jgi:hypothetical protein
MGFKSVVAGSLLTAAAVLAKSNAFADDGPVEKPAVDRPALPSGSTPSSPSEQAAPARASSQGETRQRSQATDNKHADGEAWAAPGNRQRTFFYLGAGPGLLWGLSGGRDFERTNPALTGAAGIEIPLRGATGLGFELNGDLELAGQADRGMYSALLLRARLGQMLTPKNRLWGAVGVGGAGYQSGSLAFSLAAGTSLMLVPKFGLDFSANLNLLGSSNGSRNPAIQDDYPGGAVLLIAVRALFEFHR